ncbi:MAG: CoA ester lyase [Pseudomonadota bacterium]|mgnify:CR=1 FL=1
MTTKNIALRRSFLFVPGANSKAVEKTKSLPADCIIFDLEDAVAPDAKNAARVTVVDAIAGGGYGSRQLIIRTNAINSEWFESDIEAAIATNCAAILLPKISSKADLDKVVGFVNAHNGGKSVALWAMIETPMAIINIAQICSAAETLPLYGIILGLNDMAKDTGAKLDANRAAFHYAMAAAVNAASAYGIAAIDAVYNDIVDMDSFAKQTEQARDFGFDGKCVIHPTQIAPCNQIFSPSPSEIEAARAIVAAFSDPANFGKAVINVNGQMAELLHLEMAKKLLATAETIQKML